MNQEGERRSALSSAGLAQSIEGLGQTKGQREGAMVSFVNSTQLSLTWEDGLKEELPMNIGCWAHLRGVFLAELTEAGKTHPTSGRYHSMGLVSELCESGEGEVSTGVHALIPSLLLLSMGVMRPPASGFLQ